MPTAKALSSQGTGVGGDWGRKSNQSWEKQGADRPGNSSLAGLAPGLERAPGSHHFTSTIRVLARASQIISEFRFAGLLNALRLTFPSYSVIRKKGFSLFKLAY